MKSSQHRPKTKPWHTQTHLLLAKNFPRCPPAMFRDLYAAAHSAAKLHHCQQRIIAKRSTVGCSGVRPFMRRCGIMVEKNQEANDEEHGWTKI